GGVDAGRELQPDARSAGRVARADRAQPGDRSLPRQCRARAPRRRVTEPGAGVAVKRSRRAARRGPGAERAAARAAGARRAGVFHGFDAFRTGRPFRAAPGHREDTGPERPSRASRALSADVRRAMTDDTNDTIEF